MTNQEQDIFNTLVSDSLAARHRCYAPGCDRTSTRTHILQQKNVLQFVADRKNKIIEVWHSNGFKPMRFLSGGVPSSNTLSFQGFCNKCDTKIFIEIEKNEIDFGLYHHQILLIYRGLVHELHKTVSLIKAYEAVLLSEKFSAKSKQWANGQSDYFNMRMRILNYQKLLIEDEIAKPFGIDKFKVIRRTLPPLRIATAALVTSNRFVKYEEMEDFLSIAPSLENYAFPSNALYIALIPSAFTLECLFVYTPDRTQYFGINIADINVMSNNQLLKLISNILIQTTETWCLSNDLLGKLKSTGAANEMLRLRQEILPLDGERETLIDFNLFDGLID